MEKITTNSVNVFVFDKNKIPIPGATVQVIYNKEPFCEATTLGSSTAPTKLIVPGSVDAVALRAVFDGHVEGATISAHENNFSFTFRQVDLGKTSPPPPTLSANPHVLSLHGIRTRGKWQKEITDAFGRASIWHSPLDYDYFLFIKLVIPFTRRNKIKWLQEEYTKYVKGSRPSLIAHSYGTYIVARALERYPEIELDRVIFCGSIVERVYDWSHIINRGQVNRVLNDYGRQDIWARLVGWVVKDAGDSGRTGFEDKAGGKVLERYHPKWGHSDYFYSLNYEKNWIPFLKGTDPPPLESSGRRHKNWKFRTTLLVLTILIACLFWYLGSDWREAIFSRNVLDKLWLLLFR